MSEFERTSTHWVASAERIKFGLSHTLYIASLIFEVNSVDAVSIVEKHESWQLFLYDIFIDVLKYVTFIRFMCSLILTNQCLVVWPI